MTKQQIVNKVYDVFVVQKNKASVNKNGVCEYGHPDTTGCAVACLMGKKVRKELYKLEQNDGESFPVNGSEVLGIIPRSYQSTDKLCLLTALQLWHDDYGHNKRLDTKERKLAFKKLCLDLNLQFPGDN